MRIKPLNYWGAYNDAQYKRVEGIYSNQDGSISVCSKKVFYLLEIGTEDYIGFPPKEKALKPHHFGISEAMKYNADIEIFGGENYEIIEVIVQDVLQYKMYCLNFDTDGIIPLFANVLVDFINPIGYGG